MSCGDVESNPGPKLSRHATPSTPESNLHNVVVDVDLMDTLGTSVGLALDSALNATGPHIALPQPLVDLLHRPPPEISDTNKDTQHTSAVLPQAMDVDDTHHQPPPSVSSPSGAVTTAPAGTSHAQLLPSTSSAQHAPASSASTSARQSCNSCCPIQGCQAARYHMTRETLIRHLERHAHAGEAIPTAFLTGLQYFVCTPCRHLVKVGRDCSFCSHKKKPSPAASEPNAQLQSTNDPYQSAFPSSSNNAPPTPTRTPLSSSCPQLHPGLEDVLMAQLPTVRHIPAACRHQFATLLGDCLKDVATNPTWEGVHALYCLPKLTLWAPRQRALQQPSKLAHEIKRRLDSFQAGNIGDLWDAADISSPARRSAA